MNATRPIPPSILSKAQVSELMMIYNLINMLITGVTLARTNSESPSMDAETCCIRAPIEWA